MSGPPSFPAEQCRAKAAELLEAARQSPYLDQQRLYQEIAEQWLRCDPLAGEDASPFVHAQR